MINTYAYNTLGQADHGWLKARHHFSFSQYYNANRMNFGVLHVINDDIIQPKMGFSTHSHQDMEIITYVRKGAISHKDSMGNKGKTKAGDVQVMSAGTGIQHSEYNLESEETSLYQIWIEPNQLAVQPRWETKQFPQDWLVDKLNLLVSGYKAHQSQNPLFIYQKAAIYAGRLKANSSINHPIIHQAYILVSFGSIRLSDGKQIQTLQQGDGAEVVKTAVITIEAVKDAEVLVIDVPV